MLAGVLALALSGSGLGLYLFVVSVWAALTGFLELYSGLRRRCKDSAARDWIITGGLTALLALGFLLISADAIFAIGLFGAWAVVVGVFQAIGGVSLRGAARTAAAGRHDRGERIVTKRDNRNVPATGARPIAVTAFCRRNCSASPPRSASSWDSSW